MNWQFVTGTNKKLDLVPLEANPAVMENAINMTLQFMRDPNPAYHPLAQKFHYYSSLNEGVDLLKKVNYFAAYKVYY